MTERGMPKRAIERAAAELRRVPAYAWRSWLVYLLKCLEANSDPDEYQSTLRAVQCDIRSRLATGQW